MAKKVQKKAVVKSKASVARKPQKIQKTLKAKKAVAVKATPKKAVAAVKAAVKTVAAVKVQPQKPMPQTHAAVAQKPVAPKMDAKDQKALFKVGNHVVYPTHGVGKILAQESQMIGDIELKMLVIAFEKDKMTLRVPMHRAAAAGLRPISSGEHMKKVFVTLKMRARTSRGMWSRRAQEYEAKINSGDVLAVAEVVRDLHQNVDQSERSYSERMIYESALARLVGELAAAEGSDHKTATDKLMKLLRAKVAAANAAAEAAAKEAA